MATKGDISDLDELIYGGEPLIPLLSGFSRRRTSGIVQSDVRGGLTRQRKKFYNQAYTAEATYRLDTPGMQDFIKSFFERNEGSRFVAYLRADRPILEPYVVQVISDWEDDYASALDATMTVTLEIVSVREPGLDDLIFPMYKELGDDMYDVLIGLGGIVKAIPLIDFYALNERYDLISQEYTETVNNMVS